MTNPYLNQALQNAADRKLYILPHFISLPIKLMQTMIFFCFVSG